MDGFHERYRIRFAMRFGVGQGLELGMFGQGLTLRIWIEKEIDRGPLITTVSASKVLTQLQLPTFTVFANKCWRTEGRKKLEQRET